MGGLAGATAGFIQQVEDAAEDEEEADRRDFAALHPYRDSDDEDTDDDNAMLEDIRDRRRSAVTWVDKTSIAAGKAPLAVSQSASSRSVPVSDRAGGNGKPGSTSMSASSTSIREHDDLDQHGDMDGSVDWTAVRDGSISRRPRWRRPGPAW